MKRLALLTDRAISTIVTGRFPLARILMLVGLLCSCAEEPDTPEGSSPPISVKSVESVESEYGIPALSIYTYIPGDYVPSSASELRVVVAAHSDGTVVWSDDLQFGGPPYNVAQIDGADVGELVDTLREQVIPAGAEHPHVIEAYVIGHAPYAVVSIAPVDGGMTLMSAHEIYESSHETAGTPVPERLTDANPDFPAFRERWNYVKGRILDLIPEHEDAKEDVEFRRKPSG